MTRKERLDLMERCIIQLQNHFRALEAERAAAAEYIPGAEPVSRIEVH